MNKQPLQNKYQDARAEMIRQNLKSVVAQIIAEMYPLRKQNEGQISRESMAKNKPRK